MTQGFTRSSGCRCGLVATALLLAAGGRIAPGADASGSPKKAKPKFELKDGDRVVFLGNTLIEREQQYGYWETMLTARYPDRKIIFRNLGWDGDTVWAESRGLFDPPEKGYARLLAHVGRIKPTVLFLGYGNNEAFAGKPGLPRFVKQYNKLLDDLTRVSAKGVRFVLLSPIEHEKHNALPVDPRPYNQTLARYAAEIQRIANNRKMSFIDLIESMKESNKALLDGRPYSVNYTDNGLHLNSSGYSLLSTTIEITLFGSFGSANRKSRRVKTPKGVRIERYQAILSKAEDTESGIRFQCKLNQLPKPGFMYSLFANGLPKGAYWIRVDKKKVVDSGFPSGHREFERGVRFAVWPDAKQFESLRQTIIAKNRLYFHSWRPQNVTYLFLFRKHEQGQNAKEMKEFQRLVAAKEKEIDRLKKPVTRTYELIRVKAKKAKGGK